ncbi:MAG: SGNH/GDSL hydrolase family protein [Gemmatimonadetes bacterium]|nr:SGNH/GDSL hydrolase family protein [Gemmatimonadota bacterium]
MASTLLTFLRRLGGALRSGWLMLGVTLALLLAVEGALRWRRVRAERAAHTPPGSYVAGDPRREPWWETWRTEFDAVSRMEWHPYVYFRRAPGFRGSVITIDSLGRRGTPQPRVPAEPRLRVRLYGGSTMWGEPLREDRTIAAEIARRLQPLAGPGARIEVTNLGESGYVFTQEVVQLLLDLRNGERPDVVLFYDGLNDVSATIQRGVAGDPQNESNRIAEFQLGRALDRTRYPEGLARETGPLGAALGQALTRSGLVEWARGKRPPRVPAFIPGDSVAARTVRTYVATVRIVEALAAAHGFVPVYAWQPNLHATPKRLDPYEKNLMTQIGRDPLHSVAQVAHRRIPAQLDSAMRSLASGRFVDLTGLFKDDTLPVFVDRVGHNTEAAVPGIVDGLWPALRAAVEQKLAARPARS